MVLSSLVLLWKNVEAALAGRRCQSRFSGMEVGSLVVKRRCDEVVENEL